MPLPISNANHQQETTPDSYWKLAGRQRPCSRYFGDINGCLNFIRTGDSIFDTGVPIGGNPSNGRSTHCVCEPCARAAHVEAVQA